MHPALGHSMAGRYLLLLPAMHVAKKCPSLYAKRSSRHRVPCICNDSNKNNNKNPPWKAKPKPLPIIPNWIGCSLPEISWAISKRNYPQMHVCPIILAVISAATTFQACSLPPSHSFLFFLIFSMKFTAASVLPPACWGRKESEGERINIYSMFIFSESLLQWWAVMCVFALSAKGALVALRLEK